MLLRTSYALTLAKHFVGLGYLKECVTQVNSLLFHKFSNEESCGLNSARKRARKNSNTQSNKIQYRGHSMYASHTFAGSKARHALKTERGMCHAIHQHASHEDFGFLYTQCWAL